MNSNSGQLTAQAEELTPDDKGLGLIPRSEQTEETYMPSQYTVLSLAFTPCDINRTGHHGV